MTITLPEHSMTAEPKYVVIDEKALGVILNVDVQVLASHSMHIDCPGVYPAPMGNGRMRNALPQDFKHFRVLPPPELRVAFGIETRADVLCDRCHDARQGVGA
jgi:hypothetical protein